MLEGKKVYERCGVVCGRGGGTVGVLRVRRGLLQVTGGGLLGRAEGLYVRGGKQRFVNEKLRVKVELCFMAGGLLMG